MLLLWLLRVLIPAVKHNMSKAKILPSVSLQAVTVFTGAAAYIRKYGWQRSGMSTHGKPRCSMGALASSYQHPVWNPELSLLMYDVLYRSLGGITLTQFNAQAKSGEDVALLFEKVACKLQVGDLQR